ncbi:UDP-2,3-diacylglucosamine diphosphatase [uncultured Psychrosphaera sp.]|uniref:UDP-2,3-diacylglucosamine diphosphatase n=1 Tax=uncultured Psychrosphaera sp. TaxID=1403522 RepID=UPI0030FBF93B
MSSILVIADLHLSSERPDISQCFFDFLIAESNQHKALYILGDLFESWVGDDDINPFTQQVAQAIHDFSAHTSVYFIHGNRDFLLGKKYAKRCGMTLLSESHGIVDFNKSILFMHGDQLCLDDVEYQKFRNKSRTWWWKTLMLCLPLSFRKNKAAEYRAMSKLSQMDKSDDIMDVAEREVQRVVQTSNCDWLIHGHTHRPNIHQLDQHKQRIVVGDWYTQGSVLLLSNNGAELKSLPLPTN